MNLYLVKVLLNGICRDLWIRCRDEADAAERAQAQLNWGGRIIGVKFIRRESPFGF